MKTKIPSETTVTQVSQAMRQLLLQEARQAGLESAFVQRRSKLDGATFVQTLTLGWLANPQASLNELTQTAACLGVDISPQGLDQRFTRAAAACLQQVLNRVTRHRLAAAELDASLWDRFSMVSVRDSTVINLPAALAELWRGCGGRAGMTDAALKVQLQYDLKSGALLNLDLEPGRASDRVAASQHTPLPAGALWLADLGYFSLDLLTEQPDTFFLVHPQSNVVVYTADGRAWHLRELLATCPDAELDLAVEVGAQHRIPCRLLARRAAPDVVARRRRQLRERARKSGRTVSAATRALAAWTLFITNVPVERLSLAEAFQLGRCRWQIEWVFKRWKSYGHLDEWRSTKPDRILCEVYAKLLGQVLVHWLCLPTLWGHLDRSFVKATQAIQKFALALASALAVPHVFGFLLAALQRCLARTCRVNRSCQAPRMFQLMEDLA